MRKVVDGAVIRSDFEPKPLELPESTEIQIWASLSSTTILNEDIPPGTAVFPYLVFIEVVPYA